MSENSAVLPLDVSSRVRGLLSHVAEIRERVEAYPVLNSLIRDYQEMAKRYILLFELSLGASNRKGAQDRWLKRHEMLDKLTREWHLIFSIASAVELGSSYLERFQPYVKQAIEDIGLSDDGRDFLLIPVFGEAFSLVRIRYSSSNIVILNLPISVIHSPWELSVIWHEMAGLKVVELRDKIKAFLVAHPQQEDILSGEDPMLANGRLIADLFRRIANDEELEKPFLAQVKSAMNMDGGPEFMQSTAWSQDWFEQLYEDACSVFAFGEEFVEVLSKILSRQERKLTADRKHPDLATRLQVAHRLLALQNGEAPPPTTNAERLTDELLWAFIQQTKDDPVAALPVAYAKAGMSATRQELLNAMQDFNASFGNLNEGTINELPIDLGPMSDFADRPSQSGKSYIPEESRISRVSGRLDELFEDKSLEGLLKRPFSPSDELDFAGHAADQRGFMEVRSSTHGVHGVIHFSHSA